ncbi:unnamed protein product [Auanema sp. JU1783]|nr:unnamed protein product [Auanema sp. JU1783]
MSRTWYMLAVAFVILSCISTSVSQITLSTPPPDDPDSDDCTIYKNWTQPETCSYVKENADACEGGGYFLWSRYVECSNGTVARVFVIIGATAYLLAIFIMLSAAGDDFFSPSVAGIVNHLKISESIAGVTFLAFGNGAPDVFSSIASVLSTSKPQANLALGELLGGNVFVTCMVTATIILTSPFEVDAISTTRDLIFFIVTAGWILFVFLYSDNLSIWEPIVALVIYAVYVVTVIVIEKSVKKKKKERALSSARSIRAASRNNIVVPSINILADAVERIESAEQPQELRSDRLSVTSSDKRNSIVNQSIFPPIDLAKAFGHESEEDDEDEVVILHGHVYRGEEARSRACSTAPPPIQNDGWSSIAHDLIDHLRSVPTKEEWSEMNLVDKIMAILRIIPLFILKATVPLSENSWSKAVALLHSIIAPSCFLFCIKLLGMKLPYGGPGLWLYGLILSVILVVLVIIFTKFTEEPRFYKEVYSYLGFIMAIAWIYMAAAEVVNVVTMIGIISGIPHEVLGLTILAWSNSIGDLIADVSVVKQGYPRMAMAAAIGGPLFNLLVGFGLPFTIALMKKNVKIAITFTPTFHLLILFLGISLFTLLIGIFVQKFYVRRPFALVLIGIYVCFMIMVILDETNTVVWN